MRNLEIKLTGLTRISETIIEIDGENLNFKKNKFGSLNANYQTENEKVKIIAYRMLDVGGFFWFITQLFFFIISIFGIFDYHRKEKYFIMDFEMEVELEEGNNELTLQLYGPYNNGQAINVETNLKYQEVSNIYLLDTKANKTLKGLKAAKIILAIVIVAIAILVIIDKF